jgi:hypothetical protein
MKMRSLICLLMLACTGSLFAQTISFRADQVTVPPSELNANKGVQVGLYMETTGNGTEDWSQINIRFSYTENGGAILAGDPVAQASDFVGANNGPEVGISSPGTPLDSSTFLEADIINVATLGGATADFMPNLDDAAVNSGGFVIEDINTVTSTITLSINGAGDFIRTVDDTEYLVGMVEFPVDETAPFGSWITVDFDPAPAANFVQNNARRAILDAQGNNTDGYVLVFEALDCAGATAADNQGTASGSSIEINYLDPQAGGVGGDITLTLPHGTTDPDQIRIVPTDGSGEIVLTGGQIGAGSSTLDLTTQGNGTPATGAASVSYDIFYAVNNPLGGLSEGEPCRVTVTWAAPECTITPDATPVVGNPLNYDVTLTNVVYDAGNSRFGTVTTPNGSVDLGAPSSVAGTTLTFTAAVAIASVAAGDVGNYTVGDATGANGNAIPACSAFLGLECPTNNTVCPTTEVVIGGMITIPLAGDNVATWDIIYNGTTTTLPGTDTTFDVTNLDGNATEITVRANGFDDMGAACSDDVICTLNFADPTCTVDSVQWDDNGTPTDVCPDGTDVGEMVTVTITTTGATGAFIPGASVGLGSDVVFVETSGVFGVDEVVTAEATFANSVLGTFDVVTEGPAGTTDGTCPFELCLSTFVTGGNAFLDGASLCINGTPNFTFEIYAIPGANCTNIPFGANITLGDLGGSPQLVGTITTDGDGNACVVLGEDGTIFVPDACYYIVFNGQVFAGTQNAAVPTLGEWGMIAFIMLLMGAAVFHQRKRRMA